jgi:hypothetical protein
MVVFKFKFILQRHDTTLYAIYSDFVHHSRVKLQVFSGKDGIKKFLSYLTTRQTYPQVLDTKAATPVSSV